MPEPGGVSFHSSRWALASRRKGSPSRRKENPSRRKENPSRLLPRIQSFQGSAADPRQKSCCARPAGQTFGRRPRATLFLVFPKLGVKKMSENLRPPPRGVLCDFARRPRSTFFAGGRRGNRGKSRPAAEAAIPRGSRRVEPRSPPRAPDRVRSPCDRNATWRGPAPA